MATGQICGVLLMATGQIFQTFPTDVSTTNYTGLGGVGDSLLNFGVILIILTLLNPSMTTKLPYHTPMLRGVDEIQNIRL